MRLWPVDLSIGIDWRRVVFFICSLAHYGLIRLVVSLVAETNPTTAVSSMCLSFIKALLVTDVERRMSAAEACQHEWLQLSHGKLLKVVVLNLLVRNMYLLLRKRIILLLFF